MTILASDDFNRADGALGANWELPTVVSTMPVIVSNTARTATTGTGLDSSARYSAITWPNDQYSECTVTAYSANRCPFPICRDNSAGGFLQKYGVYYDAGAGELVLAKFVSNAYSELNRTALTLVAGDRIAVRARGTKIASILNRRMVAEVTDTSHSVGKAGFHIAELGLGTQAEAIADDWEGGDLTGFIVCEQACNVSEDADGASDGTNPLIANFANNITAGNFIAIFIQSGYPFVRTITSVKVGSEVATALDTMSDTYERGGSWYVKNAAGGNTDVALLHDIAVSTADYRRMIALEFSEVDTTSPIDGHNTTGPLGNQMLFDHGVTDGTTFNIVTATAYAMIVGFAYEGAEQNNSLLAGTGYVTPANGSMSNAVGDRCTSEIKLQAVAGTVAVSFTWNAGSSSDATGNGHAIALKPAGSVGPALSITSVAPTNIYDDETGIVITGTGFGSTQGLVKVGGRLQTITAWSDTSITFTAERSTDNVGLTTLQVLKPF